MANPDAKRHVNSKAGQTKEGKTPGQGKPRSPQREAMEETARTTQKKTLDKPRRKPSIFAKAALAAGITAATLFGGQNEAAAARISSTHPTDILAQAPESNVEVYTVRPPEEFNTSEPGNDIHSLLKRIDGKEMQQYSVSGEPGKYRIPMEGGRHLQAKLIKGGKQLSVQVASRPNETLPGPTIISSHFIVNIALLGMEGPKLHVANGPKYVHLNVVDEPTGKHLRIMVPKASGDPEEGLIVQMFSLGTSHQEIISGLAKLPKIREDSSREISRMNSIFENAQVQIDEKMPASPIGSGEGQGMKPVSLLLDEVIAAYEAGLNFMIDSLGEEVKGMKSEEKKKFLKKVLPHAVGALLRPYHVSYNGISNLPKLDEIISNPDMETRELQRFAKEHDLVPEFNGILDSFLDSLR